MSTPEKYTGREVSRLEGRLKVTGAATYAAEYAVPDLLYGYIVSSTVTKGKIKQIDVEKALAYTGVKAVITHENRPKLSWFDILYADMDAPPGTVFKPLYDEQIKFNGQPVAVVIAEDFETARYAATLINISFEEEPFDTCLDNNLSRARSSKIGLSTPLKPPPPKPKGDFETAFTEAPAKAAATFRHGIEHHNPMELFATTTVYEGKGKLTVYDKTQGAINNQIFIANVFGLKYKNVRVLAPFVGGGFGSGLRPQYQLFLCVMAALHLKRNVRIVMDREQMFAFSHRPQNIQQLRFCADSEGKLTGLGHDTVSETSSYEDYGESVSNWSHRLYPAANTLFKYKLVPLDVHSPADMRAPGGCSGMHAIECTMDMLAEQLNMDPLKFRLLNYGEKDPSNGKPFTSKELRQCYEKGAERFGWHNRNPEPGAVIRGSKLVGCGMATGIWDAYQFPSRVEIIITAEGKAIVNNAVTDIGTGTYTVMTQIAADELGLPLEDVTFSYGDSRKPFSMIQGGSAMTSSTGVAIVKAARALKKKLLHEAHEAKIPGFAKLDEERVALANGGLAVVGSEEVFISYRGLVTAAGGKDIKVKSFGKPEFLKLRKYSLATHSAAFVEVEVDKDLKTITVTRAVSAVAAGKIINPKTARSQIVGSMVWGISKALHEETLLDDNLGKYMNRNLGEYHIPVHADVNELDVIFADEKDEIINEIGVKGVGEIGIVAIPAAIANAIYNATGKRVNKLPIHFDELF